MSREETDIIRGRLVTAKADLSVARAELGSNLSQMYADPNRAYDGICDFYKEKGEGALIKKLETLPNHFGAMRGHLGGGFTERGARANRATAAEMAKNLPSLLKGVVALEQKVETLKKAFHGEELDFPPGGGRNRGGPNR